MSTPQDPKDGSTPAPATAPELTEAQMERLAEMTAKRVQESSSKAEAKDDLSDDIQRETNLTEKDADVIADALIAGMERRGVIPNEEEETPAPPPGGETPPPPAPAPAGSDVPAPPVSASDTEPDKRTFAEKFFGGRK